MVSDRAKDQAEDITAATIEAIVSAVPFVGGPAAVIINRSFGSSVQRRSEKILAGIEADIVELQALGRAQSPSALLESEEFIAALHATFRAAQETASEGKRKLLRNALLNGFVVRDPGPIPPRFIDLVGRFETEHIEILRELETLVDAHKELVSQPVYLIRAARERRGEPALPFLQAYFDELRRDGLISQNDKSTAKEEKSRNRIGFEVTTNVVTTESWFNVSRLGTAFLAFLRDPLLPQPPNQSPGV
jgi:hypothetical protein